MTLALFIQSGETSESLSALGREPQSHDEDFNAFMPRVAASTGEFQVICAGAMFVLYSKIVTEHHRVLEPWRFVP